MNEVEGVRKADFLTDEQKNIKQMLMEELLWTIQKYTTLYGDKFDGQAFSDFITSIIIMFTREIISRTILNSDAIERRDVIVDQLLGVIKSETIDQMNKVLSEVNKKVN